MTTPRHMPARNHHSAPHFDAPSKLARFLEDVEIAAHDAALSEEDTIVWATRYVRREDSELWTALPAYIAMPKVYQDFKTAVIALYPGADLARQYRMRDMDDLVAERTMTPIASRLELGAYCCAFSRISSHLRSHDRASEPECQRAFLRGFSGDLRSRLDNRLKITNIAHRPDDPYTIEAVTAAADFLLSGTITGTSRASTSQPIAPLVSDTIKPERVDLATLNEALLKIQATMIALARDHIAMIALPYTT
ncbi:hypothetical protein BD410DRAFT_710203 [Rickenella mellea]|uniref:Uncharacterized protein n=1 Tax=Rickenella mellea TaxID=50990 RepID=A0A4R5XGC2_9AGAM|nr:hypothetical protein BD410DRAFT_710203 [Rickenella mellea]